MRTIVLILTVSVLFSLNAQGAGRKSPHSNSQFSRGADGTFYLGSRGQAPRARAEVRSEAPAASSSAEPAGEKLSFFEKLFGKKTKKPASPKLQAPNQVQDPIVYYADVLARSNRSNTKLVIDVSKQRAFLLVDGRVAMNTPVSTARTGKYTPRGTHYIGERVRSGKVSTIYDSSMPYWMRLGGSLYGVHAGYLPGYPASAGCVRLPMAAAQVIYDNTRSGTVVSIYSSWSGYAAATTQKESPTGYSVVGL
jgi:lipoprotein-anchoring transpeptidase ErfK/SrfK